MDKKIRRLAIQAREYAEHSISSWHYGKPLKWVLQDWKQVYQITKVPFRIRHVWWEIIWVFKKDNHQTTDDSERIL